MSYRADVLCDCGADLHVSGDMIYVCQEASRFAGLHSGDGHKIREDPDPKDALRGRDNGTRWWEETP